MMKSFLGKLFNKSRDNLACIDYLTNLSNRRGLYEYYNALNKDTTVHIMFIDIDNFKRVNDIYGHSMGDMLLKNIGSIIQKSIKEGFISRIGGDEFVVILDDNKSSDDIYKLAENLIDIFNTSDIRHDIISIISMSIGIVIGQNVDQALDEVLYKCDLAMYQAKAEGKNRYVVYKSLEKVYEMKKNMEAEMEQALMEGQFEAYLQPKVNMLNSKLYGAEALARWNHPTEGLRIPGQFIPLFEKNGFILKLDMYIYEEVCKLKASWKDTPLENIMISVNMHRLHFYNREFPDILESIADKYGVNIRELEIEITESMFIKDSMELINMIQCLKDKGFMITIDDFGSGYSALNMLKDIPVDTVKIDKEFLKISSNDLRGKKVIKNVINMCKDLKLEVIAEGVETKTQIEFLTSSGCQIAQGYYYTHPLPAPEFADFALSYISDCTEVVKFTFNQTFEASDSNYLANFEGVGFSFAEGVMEGQGSLHLPGGQMTQNVVMIPTSVIYSESYTIALWLRPTKLHTWSSVFYIKYENGFISIVPNAWEGNSTFRLRDSKEVNGWYDIASCSLWENKWTHVAITYNAKTETAAYYINGLTAATMENVPTLRYVKLIYVGGDIFQDSFEGDVSELMIFNEVKSPEEIEELYKVYYEDPTFKGDKTQ